MVVVSAWQYDDGVTRASKPAHRAISHVLGKRGRAGHPWRPKTYVKQTGQAWRLVQEFVFSSMLKG